MQYTRLGKRDVIAAAVMSLVISDFVHAEETRGKR
ncbi:hypothetical protein PUATCC27989T_01772 [Phytobacter ursingii]|nr:hypothetical protein PUATCC27989T_01772 [Phytobacter ursingii]